MDEPFMAQDTWLVVVLTTMLVGNVLLGATENMVDGACRSTIGAYSVLSAQYESTGGLPSLVGSLSGAPS